MEVKVAIGYLVILITAILGVVAMSAAMKKSNDRVCAECNIIMLSAHGSATCAEKR